MTNAVAIEQRDEAIVEALVAGRSVRVVQREFSLTVTELDQALERCFPLDTAARLRTIRGDLSRLDRLIEKFYVKAIAGDGDVSSAALVVKAWERKAGLLGLADGFILSLSFGRSPACISESATTDELVDAGLNYWKELNPEDRYHVSAHLFLVNAWRKVWPCGSKGNEKQ